MPNLSIIRGDGSAGGGRDAAAAMIRTVCLWPGLDVGRRRDAERDPEKR